MILIHQLWQYESSTTRTCQNQNPHLNVKILSWRDTDQASCKETLMKPFDMHFLQRDTLSSLVIIINIPSSSTYCGETPYFHF